MSYTPERYCSWILSLNSRTNTFYLSWHVSRSIIVEAACFLGIQTNLKKINHSISFDEISPVVPSLTSINAINSSLIWFSLSTNLIVTVSCSWLLMSRTLSVDTEKISTNIVAIFGDISWNQLSFD